MNQSLTLTLSSPLKSLARGADTVHLTLVIRGPLLYSGGQLITTDVHIFTASYTAEQIPPTRDSGGNHVRLQEKSVKLKMSLKQVII